MPLSKARVDESRLAALKADIASLKASIHDTAKKLQNGGLSMVTAPRRSISGALKLRRVLEGHLSKVHALDWSIDGEQLVSAGQDSKLLHWNARTQQKIHSVKLSVTWAMAVACQPVLGSSTVACGGLDNVCSLYDMNMGSAKRAQLEGHEGYVSAVRFLSPSSLLTSSGDSTCILWDVSLGREVIRFTDHASDVLCIAPCPTSAHTFVSGSVDSTAKVWDTRTGRSVQSFVGHDGDVNSVRFMRNGLAFGTGGDDSVSKIFDLRSCARVNEFANEAVVTSVTSGDFSASGRIWFSGHDDFNVYAWDTLEENPTAPLYSLKEHSHRVSCLAVNQPGTALCTGSWDTRIRVWA